MLCTSELRSENVIIYNFEIVITFNEKEKLSNIRETMAKLKNQPLIHKEEQTKREMRPHLISLNV